MAHICVNNIGHQQCFRLWFVACLTPNSYLIPLWNIANWTFLFKPAQWLCYHNADIYRTGMIYTFNDVLAAPKDKNIYQYPLHWGGNICISGFKRKCFLIAVSHFYFIPWTRQKLALHNWSRTISQLIGSIFPRIFLILACVIVGWCCAFGSFEFTIMIFQLIEPDLFIPNRVMLFQ